MKKNSKRYKELLKNSKDFKSTELKEILELIKKNSTTKFDESIDVSLRIGLKQSKGGDFNLRTVTQLPSGTGKKLKVAVLCEPDNPKLGTVSTNIKKSVTEIKSGLVEVKHDKDGNIGTSIGRKSFSTDSLIGNLKHLVDFIKKEKPDAIKGEFIKNIYVTSSMGVSLKVSNKSI